TITSVAALLTLWLVACGSFGTGSGKEEKVSVSGPNAAQGDNRPTPGAQDSKQQVTDTGGAKQPVKYVKRRGKGARRSMPNTQQVVTWRVEDVELQIIEPQVGDQLVFDERQPTQVIQARPAER